MAGMLATLSWNIDRMRDAADTPYVAAVDLAEWLVAQGMPFREAHNLVGGWSATPSSAMSRWPSSSKPTPRSGRGRRPARSRGGGNQEDDAGWGRPRPGS